MIRVPLIAISLAAPPAAAAEPKDADAPADVVYSYGKRERPAQSVGGAVSVITADDIEAGQYAFAVDALRAAPGVVVARSGGPGGFASARLRGASSGQTLVVIDGIVVNDPAAPQGGFNFANLDVADIDRIEVLRGPQSVVYGADAIGGVILIRTKREAAPLAAYAEAGSRGTVRAGLTGRVASDRAFARVTLSGATADGLSRAASGTEPDGHRTLAASLAAGVDFGRGAALGVAARASDSRAEIDGFPPPLFLFADTEEIEDSRDFSLAARLAHGGFDEGRRAFGGALTVAFAGLDRANSDSGVETFAARGRRFAAEYAFAAPIAAFLAAEAGAEFERAAAQTPGVDESASAGAAFGLIEAEVGRLALSAGARRDEFSNFSGATTERFAAAWRLSDLIRLRASWGEGFRAPSLFELNFDQFGVVPNPDLRPERARGYDAGLDLASGVGRLSATYFRQTVEDQIDFDFARSGYFNIDRAESQGVEVEIDAELGRRASARFAYAFIDATDASGARLRRIPKHRGFVTLAVAPFDRLSLSASFEFNGAERDFPTPNAAFVRVDLRAAWAVSDALELYARLENAADAEFEDVSGFEEPGASAFAGVRVTP
jgi:vitamin B12 transporter